MAAEGIKLDAGLFDTLLSTYLRQAEDTLRFYAADAAVNLGPYQASASTSYWVMLADASRPSAAGAAPAKGTLTTYRIKQGKNSQFREALRTIKGALEKGNYPRHGIWYSLANGGPTGTYAVFVPRASMAEMALTEPSMRDVVETALGRSAGEAALDAFSDAVESGSSELLEFRADLSYLPPSPYHRVRPGSRCRPIGRHRDLGSRRRAAQGTARQPPG